MAHAFICDAIRTPFGRYGGSLATVRPDDLAAIQRPGPRCRFVSQNAPIVASSWDLSPGEIGLAWAAMRD